MKKIISLLLIPALALFSSLSLSGCGSTGESSTIVLRVCNWEEYIDLGDWDEDEVIDLEDGTEIFG